MKNPNKLYKVIAALTIMMFVSYSVIGMILLAFKKISIGDFLTWFAILGGIVSVVSLLSFFQSSTTKDDLKELQLDTLREIADSSRKLENVEQARQAAENDINSLEIKKQQMEVMIRKAGLSIFLQEQRNLYTNKVLEELNSSKELTGNLKKLADINKQIEALDGEISKDDNVDLILEIISISSNLREKNISERKEAVVVDYGSPLINSLAKVVQNAAEIAVKMVLR